MDGHQEVYENMSENNISTEQTDETLDIVRKTQTRLKILVAIVCSLFLIIVALSSVLFYLDFHMNQKSQANFQESKYFPIKDCSKVSPNDFIIGDNTTGVFEIFVGKKAIQAYCDLRSDGGGWTIIQRRKDGSVDFFRGLRDYKIGFGNISGEFWMGIPKPIDYYLAVLIHPFTGYRIERLENIFNIMEGRIFEMRIDLEDWEGIKKFAKYSYFRMYNHNVDYQITLGPYSGTAGDGMFTHNSQKFSTKDHDVDSALAVDCSQLSKGGWWYNSCHDANLNGLYHKGSHTSYGVGVNWNQWRGMNYSLKFVEMKIRPIA